MPLDRHRFRDDPVSAGATSSQVVGNRVLLALSDGVLIIRPNFIGTADQPTAAHDALAHRYGEVRLPLGCFLLPGETNVLIDTGFGPRAQVKRSILVGGRLLSHLDRNGVRPEDVDVIALSHLHLDHVGWLGDSSGEPVFPNAQIHIGRADWDYFINGDAGAALLEPHIRAALDTMADRGRVTLVDGESLVAPGVARLAAPGHTPGHSLYVIHDGGERVLLLGDAMYCPQQLTNLDWDAASDVDPALARRTRETLLRDLDRHGGRALGCHFPELIAGRALIDPQSA